MLRLRGGARHYTPSRRRVMTTRTAQHFRSSLVTLATAVALAGCGDDTATGPSARASIPASGAAARGPDLGQCGDIAVPAGSKLVFHTYAEGVQKYEWDGGTWLPRGPEAKLYANADGAEEVGIHYGGPTWESNSGSLVVGQLRTPCERGGTDIPWLLLDGVRRVGPGIFHEVDFIQRVNTVGGRAPATAGSLGELRRVPYTAEYYFYRAP
jgi:hypothetical protein